MYEKGNFEYYKFTQVSTSVLKLKYSNIYQLVNPDYARDK